MKIVILLFLCVSCGKSKMDSPEQAPLHAASAIGVDTRLSVCEKKCERIVNESIENTNKNTETTFEYKNTQINKIKIRRKDCLSHCLTCDQNLWSPSAYSMTTPIGWACTGSAYDQCKHSDPSREVYCKESDYSEP